MRRLLPYCFTIAAYGLAILFIGGLTWFVAPPGASAITALAVSVIGAVLMGVCAALTLRLENNRRLGMIGIHAALVLPLVLALGAGMRLRASLDKANTFNNALRAAPVAVSMESIANKDLPSPVAYQTVGLGSIAAVSLFAFVALLAQRPAPGATRPGAGTSDNHPSPEPAVTS